MEKQLELTGEKQPPPSTKKSRTKGGSVTLTDSIQRQSHVERLMKMGFSVTKIIATEINGKKLGSIETISKDMNVIRSRWLDADPAWFHRARLARIEAKERLLEQMIRLGKLILELQNTSPKTHIYAEAQLTTVIKSIYEIDADFDPEQYLDQKMTDLVLDDKTKEMILDKIKKTETTTS